MSKVIVKEGNYTFDAANKKVAISNIGNLLASEVVSILNTNEDKLLCQKDANGVSYPGMGWTVSNNEITLDFDTTTMDNDDKLSIVIKRDGIQSVDKGVLSLLVTQPLVDCTSIGAIDLYTVPIGENVFIAWLDVILKNKVGGSGAMEFPEVQVGIDADLEALFTQTKLRGLNAVGKHFNLGGTGIRSYATAGEIIKLDIAQASNATTFDVDVDVWGYLKP